MIIIWGSIRQPLVGLVRRSVISRALHNIQREIREGVNRNMAVYLSQTVQEVMPVQQCHHHLLLLMPTVQDLYQGPPLLFPHLQLHPIEYSYHILTITIPFLDCAGGNAGPAIPSSPSFAYAHGPGSLPRSPFLPSSPTYTYSTPCWIHNLITYWP